MRLIKNLRANLSWLDYIVCAMLAFILPLATIFQKDREINISFLIVAEMIATFIAMVIFFATSRIIFSKLARYANVKKKSKFWSVLAKILNSKKSLLYVALIIFVFWLPALCMLYPGTLINDTWGQLNQTLMLNNNEWIFSSHHPIFDTVVMSAIIIPFSKLFQSWHIGFFVYVIIQAVCTSLIFSYTIKYMREKFKQNDLTSLIFILIYSLSPILVASVQTISKDALSAWVYVIFIVKLIEVIRTKGEVLKEKKNLFVLLFVCLLCVLTKKVEAYVIMGSFLGLLIFQKENRKYMLVPILFIAAISYIITPLVQTTFKIEPSGIQEMLSLPFQQTAAYVKDHGNEVTAEEKEVIDAVLDYDKLADEYDPLNADNVKGYSQKGKTSDYVAYLKTWIQQGFKRPVTYLKATAAHLSGWFSYSIYKPVTNMNHHSQLHPELIPEETSQRSDFFNSTASVFDKIYELLSSIPIIGVLFTFAFDASIMPLFILCTMIFKRKNFSSNYLLILVPLFLSLVIGCYLAPVSAHLEGVRYLYPITYTIPVLLMLIIAMSSKKDTRYR